jgi:hypothetical protein
MYQATQTLMNAYANGPYQSALLDVYLKDNTHMQLTNADIMEDGLTIDRYTTYNNVVTMGTCVSSELNVRLNNHDGRFDGVNFTGARIYVFIDIYNTTSYRVSCGEFIVDGQPRNRSEIEIVALDIMSLLDKPMTVDMYIRPGGPPPAADYDFLYNAVRYVIWNCTGYDPGLFYRLPNASYYIDNRKIPFSDGVLTCRQYVSWAFALMGGVGLSGYSSRAIGCRWYEPWDGDEGSTQVRYVCDASNRYSLDYSNEAITITGLFYKANDQSTTLKGQPNYALDFTGNPLVEGLYKYSSPSIISVTPDELLQDLWDHYSDGILSYVPFSATVRPAPFLWPGDPVELVTTELTGYDEDGEPIYIESHESTTITHVTYKLNGATYIAAEGQSPEEHQTVPTTGSGTTTGANILAGNLTVAGTASFSGDIAVPYEGLLKSVLIEMVPATSIAAEGYLYNTYTIAQSEIGAGWTPIAIAGHIVNNRYVSVYNLRVRADDHMQVTYGLYNTSTSARSTSLTVNVLCIRTSL